MHGLKTKGYLPRDHLEQLRSRPKCPVHGRSELNWQERFRKYWIVCQTPQIVQRSAAHQQNSFGRIASANAICQLDTVHLGHIDICQYEIDFQSIGGVDHESFKAIGCPEYIVAFLFQDECHDLPDAIIVVN
jgi:hypothetical protein